MKVTAFAWSSNGRKLEDVRVCYQRGDGGSEISVLVLEFKDGTDIRIHCRELEHVRHLAQEIELAYWEIVAKSKQ